MVGKFQLGIYFIDQAHDMLHFFFHLIHGNELMGIILMKRTHPHQSVEGTAFFMPMHMSDLSKP